MYLTLPREVLANPHKDSTTPLPPTEIAAPQPSARHIDTLAGWIAAAELPLILTSNLGRDFGAVGVARGARRAPRDPGRAAACELRQSTREPPVQPGACRHGAARQGRPAARGGLRGAVVPALLQRREPTRRSCTSASIRCSSAIRIRAFTAQLAITGSSRVGLQLLDDALKARPAQRAAADRRRAVVAEFKTTQSARSSPQPLERARSEKPIRYSYVGAVRARRAAERRHRHHRARRRRGSLRARGAGLAARRQHRRRLGLRPRRFARRQARGAGPHGRQHDRRRQLHVRQSDAVSSRLARREAADAHDRLQQRPLAGRRVGDARRLPRRRGGACRGNAARRAATVTGVHEGRRSVRRVGAARRRSRRAAARDRRGARRPSPAAAKRCSTCAWSTAQR